MQYKSPFSFKALIEIEADFQIVAEFGCVDNSLEGIRDLQPDLVLTAGRIRTQSRALAMRTRRQVAGS
jgi:hypothetical protein